MANNKDRKKLIEWKHKRQKMKQNANTLKKVQYKIKEFSSSVKTLRRSDKEERKKLFGTYTEIYKKLRENQNNKYMLYTLNSKDVESFISAEFTLLWKRTKALSTTPHKKLKLLYELFDWNIYGQQKTKWEEDFGKEAPEDDNYLLTAKINLMNKEKLSDPDLQLLHDTLKEVGEATKAGENAEKAEKEAEKFIQNLQIHACGKIKKFALDVQKWDGKKSNASFIAQEKDIMSCLCQIYDRNTEAYGGTPEDFTYGALDMDYVAVFVRAMFSVRWKDEKLKGTEPKNSEVHMLYDMFHWQMGDNFSGHQSYEYDVQHRTNPEGDLCVPFKKVPPSLSVYDYTKNKVRECPFSDGKYKTAWEYLGLVCRYHTRCTPWSVTNPLRG